MSEKRLWQAISLGVILLIGGFYVATIRAGHGWGGDFAQYLLHAKNIAQGLNYADTGYIFNPHCPGFSPITYPPVFPLILSPVYKIFGLDLYAFKIAVTIFFIALLIVIFLIFKEYLPHKYLPLLLVIIGLNPFFWDFKDYILAEFPFMFFVYIAFYLIDGAYKQQPTGKNLLSGLLLSVAVYLSYGNRSLGVIFLPSLLTFDMIKNRRISALTIQIIIYFLILAVLQSYIFHSDRFFHDQLQFVTFKTVIQNIITYPKALFNFIDIGFRKTALGALIIVITGLGLTYWAIKGYVKKLSRLSIFDIFIIFYLAAIFIYPYNQDRRYLLPIYPLFIFYSFYGMGEIIYSNSFRFKKSMIYIPLCLIFISYAVFYLHADYGELKEGIGTKESKDIWQKISTLTKEDDVIVFLEPRVVNLLTGRRASTYHQPRNEEELWTYFREIKATYLVTGPFEETYLQAFVLKSAEKLQKIYANHDFEMFRITEPPA
jgi:hypothetical protein